MNQHEITAFLDKLCQAAAEQTLPRFRNQIEVANKYDVGFDPVTEADQAAETAIRTIISDRYPDHAIVGEEHGIERENAAYKWIIDPVDGTRAFISGLPTWGTLIGLYRDDCPLAGAMHQPFTDELYFCDGENSYLKRAGKCSLPLKTRQTKALSDAFIMTTSPRIFSEPDQKVYDAVENECKLARYGFDCYAYAMLAAGHVDVVMEAELHIYDIAALIPIVEKSGGIVTNWQGGKAHHGGQILACANQTLHEQALSVICDAH